MGGERAPGIAVGRCRAVEGHDQGDEPALTIGTTQFQCSPDDLLSGLVETIYVMRNALFHGEVDPDAQVLACYEPAYQIVMQFLTCVR